MIRMMALTIVIMFLGFYTWRDWYKALCGLILLMAFIEHPDFPKTLLGIPGLNPWNILLANIGLAWFLNRRNEELVWDLPGHINFLLFCYLAVVVVSFYRVTDQMGALVDYAAFVGKPIPTIKGLFNEHIINCVKWVIPGLLLFDGCRSRERFYWGLFSLLGFYALLAVQVIKWMPLSSLTGERLADRGKKILDNEIGYHRVDLAMMLAGAAWAAFSAQVLAKGRALFTLAALGGSLFLLFALALTGGRTGYAAWAAVGLVLCTLKWRKYLFLAPVAVIAIAVAVPGAVERLMQGFTPETQAFNYRVEDAVYDDSKPNVYAMTSGRNVAWPYVLEKIEESPWIGHGREAMVTLGISTYLKRELNESFPHPHNAYLELLLDNGVIGAFPVLLLFAIILWKSVALLRHPDDPVFIAMGGAALAIVLAQLAASVGSQTFYPREGVVGMWCAIGMMLRMDLERARSKAAAQAEPEPAHSPQPVFMRTAP